MALETKHKVLIGVFVIIAVIVTVCLAVLLSKKAGIVNHLEHIPSPALDKIKYNSSQPETGDVLIKLIDEVMQPYKISTSNPHKVKCSPSSHLLGPGQYCSFNIDAVEMNLCKSQDYYGYRSKHPCVFLRLNKAKDWVPDVFNDTKNLPHAMPTELKEHIKRETEFNHNKTPSVIWVSCEVISGNTDAQRNIRYMPERGFPAYYFPIRENEDDTNPLVAIHFERMTNVTTEVKCSAWEKQFGVLSTTFKIKVQ